MYLRREGTRGRGKQKPPVQLLGCGAILREVEAAATLLEDDFGVAADVWSATSLTELRRDGETVERWNRLNPLEPARRSFVERNLDGRAGPLIAATDYVRMFAEQIRPQVARADRAALDKTEDLLDPLSCDCIRGCDHHYLRTPL